MSTLSFKSLLVMPALLASGIFLAGCAQSTPVAPTPTETVIEQPADQTTQPSDEAVPAANDSLTYVITATEDGVTAYELLEDNFEISTESFGEAGLLVTAINGVEADANHYWGFYVNEEYAQQGVSTTVLNAGDEIKFVYEEINNADFSQ